MTKKTITLSTPQDVIAAVPGLIGFQPKDSLVAMHFDSPNGMFLARIDIPKPGEVEDDCANLIQAGYSNACKRVVLIAYSETEVPTWVIAQAKEIYDSTSISVIEALAVHGDKFYSLKPNDPGTLIAETKVSAAFVDTPILDSREALEKQLEPHPEAFTVEEIEGMEEVLVTKANLLRARSIIESDEPSREDLGWLIAALNGDGEFRDVIMAEVCRPTAEVLVPRWVNLVTHCPPELGGNVAGMAAYVVWCAGNGAFAWMLHDLAEKGQESAQLMREVVGQALQRAVPPPMAPLISLSEVLENFEDET
jgi:hypothetical protein